MCVCVCGCACVGFGVLERNLDDKVLFNVIK